MSEQTDGFMGPETSGAVDGLTGPAASEERVRLSYVETIVRRGLTNRAEANLWFLRWLERDREKSYGAGQLAASVAAGGWTVTRVREVKAEEYERGKVDGRAEEYRVGGEKFIELEKQHEKEILSAHEEGRQKGRHEGYVTTMDSMFTARDLKAAVDEVAVVKAGCEDAFQRGVAMGRKAERTESDWVVSGSGKYRTRNGPYAGDITPPEKPSNEGHKVHYRVLSGGAGKWACNHCEWENAELSEHSLSLAQGMHKGWLATRPAVDTPSMLVDNPDGKSFGGEFIRNLADRLVSKLGEPGLPDSGAAIGRPSMEKMADKLDDMHNHLTALEFRVEGIDSEVTDWASRELVESDEVLAKRVTVLEQWQHQIANRLGIDDGEPEPMPRHMLWLDLGQPLGRDYWRCHGCDWSAPSKGRAGDFDSAAADHELSIRPVDPEHTLCFQSGDLNADYWQCHGCDWSVPAAFRLRDMGSAQASHDEAQLRDARVDPDAVPGMER